MSDPTEAAARAIARMAYHRNRSSAVCYETAAVALAAARAEGGRAAPPSGVSRVEYDAALTRVRALRAVPEPVADPDRYIIAVTLAALGLDEPPTEAPLAERWPDGTVHDYRCQGECVRCWGADACGIVGQSCIPCTGSCVEKTGAVLPPAEPPKACPTCGSGWTYHHACPDRGSGIDGGTAT